MSITHPSDYRDFYSGIIRLHVLHHAAKEPIFGLGMIEELHRHGYQISPGTLYPLLHGLEKKGYLKGSDVRNGKSLRKVYRAVSQEVERLAGRDDGKSEATGQRFAEHGRKAVANTVAHTGDAEEELRSLVDLRSESVRRHRRRRSGI